MKKTLARALSLLLVLSILLLSLTACGENYKLRESSKKEATPVFKLGDDTVNFEVLYTFFRNQCERIDGFTNTYFDVAAGPERFRVTLEAAIAEIAEIYAMFALCRSVGIDPYGESVEAAVIDYLKLSVSGGTMGGNELTGFDDYDEYLDYVKDKFYMTDAVNRLMIRYAVCEELLLNYYSLRHPYTDADVAAFFESDDCIRIIWVSRTQDAATLTADANRKLMENAKAKLISGDHRGAIQYSLEPTTDFYIGRYTLDDAYYNELIEVAYQLGENEVSDVLDLGAEGFFVVKRLAKESNHLSEQHKSITEVYLYDLQTEAILAKAAELLQGIVYEEFYNTLTSVDFLY